MKKNTIQLWVMVMLIFCLALTGCIQSQPATPPAASNTEVAASTEPVSTEKVYDIGVFVKDSTTSFWRYVIQGATKEAEELGVNMIEYAPVETQNVEEQIRQVEDAIQAGVDAICIVALDATALKPSLQKALDAKIPVITFNSRINDFEGVSCFVGVENYDGMSLVCEKVFKDLNYEGNIVSLEGLTSGYANIERVRAITDVAAKYPEIKILASQTTNSRREEAMTVMENMLQTYPEIDAVIGHNDSVALGAVQAIQAAGKEGIIVSGFDGTLEGMEAILADTLNYSLDQSPFQQGAFSVRAAKEILDGKKIEFENPTGGTLVDKSNAQSIIDEFYKVN